MSRRQIAVSRASADALGVLGNQIQLGRHEATDVVERQVTIIREQWAEVAGIVELSAIDARSLFGRQFLNPYALSA